MGFGRPATAVEAGEAAAEERCHRNVVVDEGDRMSGFGDLGKKIVCRDVRGEMVVDG